MLASIVLVALSSARLKARDSRRISDLGEIQNALELYYNKYGYYPDVNDTSGLWYACADNGGINVPGADNTGLNRDGYDCNGYRISSIPNSWQQLQTALAEFLPTLPKDPINNCSGVPVSTTNITPCYAYFYGNVGKLGEPGPKISRAPSYDLFAILEDTGSPLRSQVKNYYFYFGTAPWNTYTYQGGQIYDVGDRLFGY